MRAGRAQLRTKLTAKQRATYERMANVCIELDLWQAGLAPKPENVIVCSPRGHNR